MRYLQVISAGWVIVLGAVIIATPGCRNNESPAPARPVVVVSVAPLAWAVDQLAGDRVEVVVMVPAGASPSTWEPSMKQVAAVSRAVLYVKVGHPSFPFEAAWLERLLGDAPDITVVDAAAGWPVVPDSDPHLWLDPAVMRGLVERLATALDEQVPGSNASARLSLVLAEIDQVERHVRASLGKLKTRRFYVFHPAWGRFASAFGLEQVAIESHGKEPGPYRLSELVQQARLDGVRVVFVQPQHSQRAAEVVAHEVGATVRVLDPLARDWPTVMRTAGRELGEVLSHD